MSVRYRRFLTERSEALLVPSSPTLGGVRYNAFLEVSGIDRSSVLLSTLMAVPVPLHDRIPSGRRRWAGTRAAFMWHPLMWLPPRLTQRQMVEGYSNAFTPPDQDTSGSIVEPDDLWVVRVALELTATGLYSPRDGTWLDILSVYDLDVDDAADVQRVQRWLDGGADETLESVDVAAYLDSVEDETWSARTALEMLPALSGASVAVQADSLLGVVDTAQEDPRIRVSLDERRSGLAAALSIAAVVTAPVPEVAVTGEPTGVVDWESHRDYFTRVSRELSGRALASPEVHKIAVDAGQRLEAIREAYWPFVDVLSDAS